MAALETWRANYSSIAIASNRSLFSIYNGAASATTIKVWRIWASNRQTASVTGLVINVHLLRFTAAPSGGTAITPVKYDSGNAALDANVSVLYNSTITLPTPIVLFGRVILSTDEYGIGSIGSDAWGFMSPLGLIWDCGYGSNGTIQPITLNAGEGLDLRNVRTSAVGTYSMSMEFTQE